MKIIDNRRKTICFADLDYGDCFTDEYNDIYMKVCVPVTVDNAIKLGDGKSYLFDNNEIVSPVNAELTIN